MKTPDAVTAERSTTFQDYSVPTYSAQEFRLDYLKRRKEEQGLQIGVCIPVKNEETTLGNVIETALNSTEGLVDKVIVMDSGSSDGSKNVAENYGVPFFLDTEVANALGLQDNQWRRGKGFNMWAALKYLDTDLITYLDSDLTKPPAHFIYVHFPLR